MESPLKKEALRRFGIHLSEHRKKKKLSYRKMADQCDVDFSDIKKYENGEKDLRLLTILDLSIGLGVHPKELLNFVFDYENWL